MDGKADWEEFMGSYIRETITRGQRIEKDWALLEVPGNDAGMTRECPRENCPKRNKEKI